MANYQCKHCSGLFSDDRNLVSEFLPSLFNAPDNHFQFENGGDDKQLAIDPDPTSDDETLYGEWWQDKPRNPDVFRQFLSIFDHPISKKDTEKVSAYDPELEEAEAKSMGEETLLEFSKGFYDPKKHDFPHNTTWDAQNEDEREPYSPLPVTINQRTNEDNLDQNSPGGFPRRFMGRPKGEFSSTEGEVTENLIQMFKNKEAAINSLTREIKANVDQEYWISPDGELHPVSDSHKNWIEFNLDTIENKGTAIADINDYEGSNKDFYINKLYQEMLNDGWTRVGQSFLGSDPTFYIEVGNIRAIPGYMDNYISKWFEPGNSILNVGDSHGRLIEITDPFPSIQKAVNKALQRNRMGSIIDNLTIDITSDYTNAYWIDPNGKVYKVRGSEITTEDMNEEGSSTHTGWIEKNLEMLKRDYGIKYPDFERLIDAGWIRVGDAFGTDWGITVKDLNHIPSSVDNLLSQFAPEGSTITVSTPNNYGANYTFEWPVKSIQNTVNQIKNRRQYYQKPVMAKQASVEEVNGIKVLVNPTFNEVLGLWKRSKSKHLRLLVDDTTGDKYIWDAYLAIHDTIKNKFIDSLHDISQDDIDSLRGIRNIFKESSIKQAGSYSSIYSDEQGAELFNEQHYNNDDEEPYVNHDQRDVSYGYNDSPENTMSGIDWPKDQTSYVVRLDQIENPADRNFPYGLPDYEVTIFPFTYSQSDGLEATNPD